MSRVLSHRRSNSDNSSQILAPDERVRSSSTGGMTKRGRFLSASTGRNDEDKKRKRRSNSYGGPEDKEIEGEVNQKSGPHSTNATSSAKMTPTTSSNSLANTTTTTTTTTTPNTNTNANTTQNTSTALNTTLNTLNTNANTNTNTTQNRNATLSTTLNTLNTNANTNNSNNLTTSPDVCEVSETEESYTSRISTSEETGSDSENYIELEEHPRRITPPQQTTTTRSGQSTSTDRDPGSHQHNENIIRTANNTNDNSYDSTEDENNLEAENVREGKISCYPGDHDSSTSESFDIERGPLGSITVSSPSLHLSPSDTGWFLAVSTESRATAPSFWGSLAILAVPGNFPPELLNFSAFLFRSGLVNFLTL